MVKFNLPHIYMIFVECQWKTITRLGNANIGMQEGIQDGGLWGLDDLIDSVKKHDKATERIRERDGVKIKSKAIVMKNNLPKKKPPKFKELVVPSVQSTNALTMDLKTKKVSEYLFCTLQIILVELYNHYWPWNKNGEEVKYTVREKERKTRDAPRSKPQKRRKCLWRSWSGPKEFEAKDLRGSRMILKVLKSLVVL